MTTHNHDSLSDLQLARVRLDSARCLYLEACLTVIRSLCGVFEQAVTNRELDVINGCLDRMEQAVDDWRRDLLGPGSDHPQEDP